MSGRYLYNLFKFNSVIPAQAGIHCTAGMRSKISTLTRYCVAVDSRLRGNDKFKHSTYLCNLFKLTLCGYILLSGISFAEDKKPAKVESEENDSWYGKSVFERPRADYTSENIRAGSFKIKPSIVLDETADNNIYASNSSKTDDIITHLTPALGVESDWGRHALSLNASGDFGMYYTHSHEDYQDYSVGASGRLDMVRETYLLAVVSTGHLHEDRGSPDSVANSKNPTEYNQNNANLSLIRNLRKVSFKLDGDYTQFNYENGKTDAGTIITNAGRDRNQYKATVRLGFEIVPEYEAFIRTSVNERDYHDAIDANGVNRDSSGYEAVAGTALNLGGKTRGEIFAGYLAQNYDSVALKDIDGVQFGGNILWNATGLTSVKTGILRGVQETSLAGYSGYIATQYSIGVEHELLYNLLAGVNISYETDEYESASVARSDKISGAGAELKYLMNRNISVSGKYNYTNRDSNISGQDYDRSLVSLGLKIAM